MNILELPAEIIWVIGGFVCHRDLVSAIAWSGTHPDFRHISVDEICEEWCRYSTRRTVNIKHPFIGNVSREEKINALMKKQRPIYVRPRRIDYAIERAMYVRQRELKQLMKMIELSRKKIPCNGSRKFYPIKLILRETRRMDRIIREFLHSMILFDGSVHRFPEMVSFFEQKSFRVMLWRAHVESMTECPFKRSIRGCRGF
jgi:hypothetical protein